MKQPDQALYRTQEEIFAEAVEKTNPQERAAFLDGACGKSSALRKQVDSLLSAHFDNDSLLQAAAVDASVTLPESSPVSEGPGSVIQNFKLLQKIGEGGMGVVYMAQQEEPVKRKVALKIIKVGMDTRQVVARFEAERQALAMMDHPNIARVLDGGSTDTGRSFFVMELVQGVPITEFCDKNKLSMKERIELFIPVCQAIQSAHQKGIIHRDIKPSNVMVSLHHGDPMPKVIDFGIAKATNQKLTEKTLFTNYAHMIGTPAYMSPEQAEMSTMDVDTRTDVYSLGVLLYELLTGTTPFSGKHLRSVGYGEMQRIIAEDEPDKPSTRMSTIQGEQKTALARTRGMQVSALGDSFKGDLDWITMKCLEKDRRRRYDTPSELAAELKRHLNNEPVSAAAPTVSYQLNKFYRRNKVLVRAAALVLFTVIGAALVSGGFAIRMGHLRAAAEEAREQASQEAENALSQAAIAEAVNQFLNEDVLGMADPTSAKANRDITLREVLDLASRSVESRFANQPLIEAAIHKTIGVTYHSLTEHQKALAHLEKARSLYKAQLGVENVDALETRNKLVGVYNSFRRFEDAGRLALENLTLCRHALGESHDVTVTAMMNVAAWYSLNNDLNKEESLRKKILKIREQVYGSESFLATWAKRHLAVYYDGLPLSSHGETLIREVLSTCAAKLESEAESLDQQEMFDWRRLQINSKRVLLAILARRTIDFESSLLAREILDFTIQVHGNTNENTLVDRYNYAVILQGLNQWDRGQELLEENLQISRNKYGAKHPQTLLTISGLASNYQHSGNSEAALESYQEACDLARQAYPAGHPTRSRATRNLAFFLWRDLGRLDEARSIWEEYGKADSSGYMSLFLLSALESYQGDFEAFYDTVRELIARVGHSGLLSELERCLKTWALLPNLPHEMAGLQVDAIATRLEEVATKAGKSTDPHVRIALGAFYYRCGQYEKAVSYLESEMEQRSVPYLKTSDGGVGIPWAVYPSFANLFLAMALHQMGDSDGAQSRLEEAKRLMGGCLADLKTLAACAVEDGLRFVVVLREAEELITGSVVTKVPRLPTK